MFAKHLLMTLRATRAPQRCIGLPQQPLKNYLLNRYTYGFNIINERNKYMQNTGVKGIRSKKCTYQFKTNAEAEDEEEVDNASSSESVNLDDSEYDELANNAMNITRDASVEHNVLIIQPYVKWGPKRKRDVQPDDQLKEAEALIRSLPKWNVALSLKVGLESIDRKTLFGSGKMDEIKALVQQLRHRPSDNQKPLTCLFISKGALSFPQKRILETAFNLPVMDRYSVVIQILRLHAISAEARIQVAMAELPYIWAQAKDANLSMSRRQGYSLNDIQREILKSRERKLKDELARIRDQRKLLRKRRQQKDYPVVAVVGYTNAGKTSLIKALTQEQTMQPRDQLFATLDVTAHAGVLPCNLKVIYMDTVGFMSDLPSGLLECFIATLEDAMLADIIVHVQDLSHDCHKAQQQHVVETLDKLALNIMDYSSNELQLPPIINVGNKIDLIQRDVVADNGDMHMVSAKQQTGLSNLLNSIEKQVLLATNRRKIKMRVRNGGAEMSWLYKNAAVLETNADASNVEHLLMDVVITENAMQQFKRQFCQ